jgi:diguanylate cyclase (GGDEF)-like protein
MADSLGLGEIEAKKQSRDEIRREYMHDPKWQTWYDRSRNLFVGEWLEFVNDSREAEVAIVAWVSEQRDDFVFVNRRGVQTHELSIEELTSMLLTGQGVIISESDIPLTDRASRRMLQNMHNKLTHHATHDELTGLANRKEFERQLENSLKKVKQEGGTDVVAYLDLDQFKVINNVNGHDAGDEVLGSIAGLLTANVTDDSCLLARLGGDEFGIHLAGYDQTRTLAVLETVLDEIRAFRFELGGTPYSLTTSIGCVVVDEETDSVLHIMRAADSACTAAKDAGRDRIQIFEQGDDDLVRRTGIMAFVSQIDQALENDRFVLNCQKIVAIDESDGQLPHYEVLLTILNEAGEPLPPQDFIVAAETYNRMGAIDRWVIKNTLGWIANNLSDLDNIPTFSINISGNSLNDDDFMDFVLEQFDSTGVPASKIGFEITETAAVASLEGAMEFMRKMKVIGCEFSLDDFGTGLSSYSYLRKLPVDYLKIDGIFVKDMVNSPNDFAVVKSINEIGHFMGMKTIAEFVESDEILEQLREIGVDYAQGYGVGKKIPLDQIF